MFRKALSIVLLAALSTAAIAQDEGRVAHPFRRILHVVDSITLVRTDSGPELVIGGYLPEVCETDPVITTEVVGQTLFIDLYQQIPFDEPCRQYFEPYRFEERIDASALFDGAVEPETNASPIKVIVANGTLRGVEPTGDADAPLSLSETFVRGELPIETVMTRHMGRDGIEISLTGTLNDSCPIPVYRAYEDWQNPGFVVVEAYAAINIAAMCLQAITPYEAVMVAPVFDTFAINGIGVPFDPAISVAVQSFVVQTMAVENATAEWVEGLLPNLKLTVTGTVDGCEDPIQLVSAPQVDNTIVVKVVRVIREGQVCTMIAREFTEELYIAPDLSVEGPITLYVNDQVVTVETE